MKPSDVEPHSHEIVQELHSPYRYIAGALLGALIFMCAIGVGIKFCRRGLENIELWHSAQSWASTTATITDVWVKWDYNKYEQVKGCYLKATYIWTQPGCPAPDATNSLWDPNSSGCRTYQGNKLKLGSNDVYHSGSSTRGWSLYKKMEEAKTSGIPWTVYMNPDNHSQAVIDRSMPVRDVSSNMWLGTLLASAGFFLGLYVFFAITDRSLRWFLRNRFPEEPWMHDEGWITGRLRNALPRKELYCLFTGIPVMLIPAPALVHDLFHGANTPGSKVGLFSLLPLVGIGCFAVGVILHRRRKRFGGAWLELIKRPIMTGDALRGWIHLPPTSLNKPIEVRIVLECEERWTTSGFLSYRKDYHKQMHYEAGRVVKIDSMNAQGFAIEFNIPESAPGTLILGMSDLKDNHQITWTLKAYAAIDGPNIDLSFKLPIFDSY